MKTFTGIVLLIIAVFSLSSCQKDNLELNWNVGIGVPLLHSKLDIADIFGDTLLQTQSDQSVNLVLDYALNSGMIDSILNVQDTLAKLSYALPFQTNIKYGPNQALYNQSEKNVLDFGGTEISYAETNKTKIVIYIRNTINQPLLFTYMITSAKKNGNSFIQNHTVPAGTSNGAINDSVELFLENYAIDFTGSTGNAVNTINVQTLLRIHPDATDSAVITQFDTVSSLMILRDLNLNYIKGYFGQKSFSLQDSGFFAIFRSYKEGSFDIEKVNGYLEFSNGIGMDATLKVDYLHAVNRVKHLSVPLQHSLFGTNINLNRASKSGNTSSPVYPYIKRYDLSMSELDKMLEIMPDAIAFSMHFTSNPLGNMSGGNDFYYKGNGLDAKIHLEIPLNLSIENLLIEDNTDLNLADANHIMGGKLTLRCKNNFPFDVYTQIYFLNDSSQVVDSLITSNKIIQSGKLDANDKVIESNKTDISIPLDERTLANLRKFKRVKIRARIATHNNKKYMIYENYHLDVKLIGEGDYAL